LGWLATELLWNTASIDARISQGFRDTCADNAVAVGQALHKVPEV